MRFSATLACHAYATSMTSVCLSVTLIDRDHVVRKKRKSAYDRIDRCLDYLHAEADPDRNIPWSWILLRKTSEVWKMRSFALRRHASNGSYVALSRCLLCFLLSWPSKRGQTDTNGWQKTENL